MDFQQPAEPGVSIVICCYNSAKRLPPTIAHIAAQEVPAHIPWEVIIVDNASTDDTAKVAQSLWPGREGVEFRVVWQPRQGLSHAREMGFEQARYEFVSFVDDDNWICPTWVAKVYEILSTHPDVGACGGKSEAIFESEPPNWALPFLHRFAIGEQSTHQGYFQQSLGALWGAGLSIRKTAWQNINQAGWYNLLEDRNGSKLSNGGDTELCYMIQMLGWRLFYASDLFLNHFIPSTRMKRSYLLSLTKSNGKVRLIDKTYRLVFSKNYQNDQRNVYRRWISDVFSNINRLISVLRNGKVQKFEIQLPLAESLSNLHALIQVGPNGYRKIYKTIEIRKVLSDRLKATQ